MEEHKGKCSTQAAMNVNNLLQDLNYISINRVCAIRQYYVIKFC